MKPKKKHTVDIYRPPSGLDGRGQTTGTPTRIARGIPCSIESLNGRELENARQVRADLSLRVRFYGESRWNLATSDYLIDERQRRINIGYIGDEDGSQFEYILTCGVAA